MYLIFFFFKQKTAYEILAWLEFRRVLFRSKWKLSNITPIPRGVASGHASNYRLISLLLLVSKMLEKDIFSKIIFLLVDWLHELQFGYLKGKSTTSKLQCVLRERYATYGYWWKATQLVQLLSIWPLSKGNCFCWNLAISSSLVWGPSGFSFWTFTNLVYVKDLPTCLSSTLSIAVFADDIKCYHRIKCVDDAEALQSDLNQIV